MLCSVWAECVSHLLVILLTKSSVFLDILRRHVCALNFFFFFPPVFYPHVLLTKCLLMWRHLILAVWSPPPRYVLRGLLVVIPVFVFSLRHGITDVVREFSQSVFRRVRKIAKSDYLLRHIRPSLRMERLGSHWTYFHEILVFDYFYKICRQNSSFIKLWQRITCTLHEDLCTFFSHISLSSS